MIKITDTIKIDTSKDYTVLHTTMGKEKEKTEKHFYSDLAGALQKCIDLMIAEHDPADLDELKESIYLIIGVYRRLKKEIDEKFKIIKVSK